MVAPAFRRFVTPLSLWIALLAVVLHSVMPMAAQTRLRAIAPAALLMAGMPANAPATRGQLVTPAARDDARAPGRHDAHAAHGDPAEGHAGHALHADRAERHAAHAGSGGHAEAPADAPDSPHAAHGDAPCPYCRIHLDAVRVPVVAVREWVLIAALIAPPIAAALAPESPEPWPDTRPRGPPAFA